MYVHSSGVYLNFIYCKNVGNKRGFTFSIVIFIIYITCYKYPKNILTCTYENQRKFQPKFNKHMFRKVMAKHEIAKWYKYYASEFFKGLLYLHITLFIPF